MAFYDGCAHLGSMGRFDLTDRQRAREALGRSQGGLDEKRACNYRAMLTTAMILLWF